MHTHTNGGRHTKVQWTRFAILPFPPETKELGAANFCRKHKKPQDLTENHRLAISDAKAQESVALASTMNRKKCVQHH